MKYSTLLEILNYVENNQIVLTPSERALWLQLSEHPDDQEKSFFLSNGSEITFHDDEEPGYSSTLQTFIDWVHSPSRDELITHYLVKKERTIQDVRTLSKLESWELASLQNTFIEKYSGKDLDALVYMYLAYAKLKEKTEGKSKKEKEKLANYHQKIVCSLTDHDVYQRNPKIIDLVCEDIFYKREDLRQQLIDVATSSRWKEFMYLFIKQQVERAPLSEEVFLAHYFKIILDRPEEVKPNYPIWYHYGNIERLKGRQRAMDATFSQDSLRKMQCVMEAASNDRIYRKKEVFERIVNEEDALKMELLTKFAKLNPFLRDPALFQQISLLSCYELRTLLHKTLEQQEEEKQRKKEQEYEPIQKRQNYLDRQLKHFAHSDTPESTKKLTKALKRAIHLYPEIRNCDTTH